MTSQRRVAKSRFTLLKIALGLALTSVLFSPARVLAASQQSPHNASRTMFARSTASVTTPEEIVAELRRVRTSPTEYAVWLEAGLVLSTYGNRDRAIQETLLNSETTSVGAMCGSATGAPLCVFDYASGYVSSGGASVAEMPMSKEEKMAGRPVQAGLMDDPTWFGDLSESELSALSEELIVETNKMRANPAAYAQRLAAIRDYYEGNLVKVPGRPAVQVVEGVGALDEAIAVLRGSPPLGALAFSPGMSFGANDHAADLGSKGITGHFGSDGSDPFARINRYGRWRNSASENISYGQATIAEWHLINLLVDDNVPSRGHRQALLEPGYSAMGAACQAHPGFRIVCVMNYASEYQEKPK